MAILQSIEGKDAFLDVNLKCEIVWMLPPKDKEEMLFREQADLALAKIGHDLQKTIGNLILTVVKIKSE